MSEEQMVEEIACEESSEVLTAEPSEGDAAETGVDANLESEAKEREEKAPAVRRTFRRALILILSFALALAAAVILSVKLSAPEKGEAEETRSKVFLEGTVVDTSRAEYSYEQMKQDLFALQDAHSDLIRVASAGKTRDGREIYYADLGSPNAKKQIFVSAGIHGREYLTPMVLMKMTEYYLVNYHVEDGQGVAYADLSEDVLIRVVPMVNPDGIMISQEGLGSLRSTELQEAVRQIYASDCAKYESYRQYGSIEEYLKHWKANAAGVDLNRNFPIEYWEDLRTGIGQPSSQSFKGEQSGSEPETQAMMRLIQELSDPVCVVSLHSQGEVLYWNCGQEGDLLTENESLRDTLAELTGYRPQNTFSHPDATLDDWAALCCGIPSVNMETGKGSCPLPVNQFETIWTQTKDLFMSLIRWTS